MPFSFSLPFFFPIIGILGLLSHAKFQPARFGVRSVLTRSADVRYSLLCSIQSTGTMYILVFSMALEREKDPSLSLSLCQSP